MLSPSKIYSKLLEIHQESLMTQNELRRMKNEIEKFTFCQQLNSITMSEYDSPKKKKTSSGGSNKNINTSYLNDISVPVSSFQPPEKLLTSFESNSYNKTSRTGNLNDNLNTPHSYIYPNTGQALDSDRRVLSPKSQIYEFENEINRKIQSFKKQFEENLKEFTQSSPWRDRSTKTSSQINPGSPVAFFQSDKAAEFSNQVDYTAKFESPLPKTNSQDSEAKLSMKNILSDLRPEPSPLFHFNKYSNEQSSSKKPITPKGFSTKGFSSKGTTPDKQDHLAESVQSAQESFRKEMDEIRSRSGVAQSYDYTEEKEDVTPKARSPFFSPLKASDLMIHKDHNEIIKSIDSNVYKNFIKPTATPLVGAFMASQNGQMRYNDFSSAHTSPPHNFRKSPDIYDMTSHNNSAHFVEQDIKEASINLNNKFEDDYPKIETISSKDRNSNSREYYTETERPSANYTGNTSNINGTPKKDESPDLDRIQIKAKNDLSDVQDRLSYDGPKHPTSNSKWYKLVAIKDNKLVSVIDGRTEYILGKSLVKNIEQKDEKFEGGIYVYNSINAALQAKFPKNARMLNAPKAIVRVSVNGTFLKINSCTSVYSAITPIEFIYVG